MQRILGKSRASGKGQNKLQKSAHEGQLLYNLCLAQLSRSGWVVHPRLKSNLPNTHAPAPSVPDVIFTCWAIL